jgi:hypothetical protein
METRVHLLLLQAVLLLGLPLTGAWLAGKPLARYAAFPPLARDLPHPPFAWPAFGGLLALGLVVLGPFIWRLCLPPRGPRGDDRTPVRRPFPWWGWLGIALGGACWTLAWTRFGWFAALQRHTFTPLWLAYVLVVNALAVRRQGTCLLTAQTGRYLLLFPLSAFFWWFFEYLNRFVQNWYYVGVAGMARGEYIFFATAAFSTVLPAVAATADWLATFRPFADNRLAGFVRIPLGHRRVAVATLVIASLGLTALSVWPNALFPLVWLAPLAVFVSLQTLTGHATALDDIRNGDWRLLARFALAALICGFWWELWNVHSLAKWQYAVPFLQRFLVFEMPVSGFMGYLPFGIECAVVVAWLAPSLAGRVSQPAARRSKKPPATTSSVAADGSNNR